MPDVSDLIVGDFHVGAYSQNARTPIVRSPLPGVNLSHASAATNAAAASVGNIGTQVWRAPQNGQLVAAWWEPTGADQPAADAASFRTQSIRCGGADGTGTRVLASGTTLVSQASNTTRGLTLDANPVFNRGEVVYGAYSATSGGTHAGTVVVAGQFNFTWRPL